MHPEMNSFQFKLNKKQTKERFTSRYSDENLLLVHANRANSECHLLSNLSRIYLFNFLLILVI